MLAVTHISKELYTFKIKLTNLCTFRVNELIQLVGQQIQSRTEDVSEQAAPQKIRHDSENELVEKA
jgi:hypothetical protein